MAIDSTVVVVVLANYVSSDLHNNNNNSCLLVYRIGWRVNADSVRLSCAATGGWKEMKDRRQRIAV